jgi:hypothetical protein
VEVDFEGLVEPIREVWADAGAQEAFRRRDEFQLCDNCEYLMNKLDVNVVCNVLVVL